MSSTQPDVGAGPSVGVGKHSRRTKTGCLTCRRRHYKCDERLPRCLRCERSDLTCLYGRRRSAGEGEDDLANRNSSCSPPSAESERREQRRQRRREDAARAIVLQHEQGQQRSPAFTVALSTKETDALEFYTSHFHRFSYQICAWTALIQLPKRSTIPSIFQNNKRHTRRMTNWASFFLPHLSTGGGSDPLSLSLAAYTALRMKDRVTAGSLYAKVLTLLRGILRQKDASSMSNQEFLRIWASTLLLAEYEAQLGNQKYQSQHVEGATTLSFIAASRFILYPDVGAATPVLPMPSSADMQLLSPAQSCHSLQALDPAGPFGELPEPSRPVSPSEALGLDFVDPAQSSSSSSTAPSAVPRNERELPAYLMQLTQRLRHSSTICESLDTEWPTFEQPPLERQSLGGLLEKSAECYAHVMPLVEDFYIGLAQDPPTTPFAFAQYRASFSPRVKLARTSIEGYRRMLQVIMGSGSGVYLSCAEPGFPFSPVIKFVNPQMAQPTVIPHVFLMFLAPFLTVEEHDEAIRYISGVFAGFDDVEGLKMDAAFPDLYVAAFWRRGNQRDYFANEIHRRQGDFMYVLNRIWGTIDHAEALTGDVPSKTEILGIALREYRDATARGLRLQNTRH